MRKKKKRMQAWFLALVLIISAVLQGVYELAAAESVPAQSDTEFFEEIVPEESVSYSTELSSEEIFVEETKEEKEQEGIKETAVSPSSDIPEFGQTETALLADVLPAAAESTLEEQTESVPIKIDGYPACGSDVRLKDRKVWILDTDFDEKKYQYYENDSQVLAEYLHGEDLLFTEGARFEVTYRFSLLKEKEYFWYGTFDFVMVKNRSDATAKSEAADRLLGISMSQDENWSGDIPDLAGMELEGGIYLIRAGDEASAFFGLTLGYDPSAFNVCLIDGGTFDVNVPGTYRLRYEVSHQLLKSFQWYVLVTVIVTEEIPLEVNKIRVLAESRDLTLVVHTADGAASTISYAQDLVLDQPLCSIEAISAFAQEPAFDFSLFRFEKEQKEELGGFYQIAATGEHSCEAVIDESVFDLSGCSYLLCVKNAAYEQAEAGKRKSSNGFADIEVDREMIAGLCGSQVILTDGSVLTYEEYLKGTDEKREMKSARAKEKTFSDAGSFSCASYPNVGASYGYIGYSQGYFNLYKKTKDEIAAWLASECNSSAASGLPDSWYVCCTELGAGNHMAIPDNATGWTVKASYTEKADGSGSLKLKATRSGGESYQDFSGYAYPLTEAIAGRITIKKSLTQAAIASLIPRYSLNGVCFGVYTDKACTDEYKSVRLHASSDDASLLAEVEVEPGRYYVREKEQAGGCLKNDSVYGPIEVGANETVSVADEGHTKVLNHIIYAKGTFARKTDMEGKNLEGAVLKMEYSPYKAGSDKYNVMASWYFRTDAEGIAAYDSAHLLASWNGHKSDTLYQLSNDTAVMPLGYYYVTEVEAPAGYRASENTYCITVSKGNNTVENETKLSSTVKDIALIKDDAAYLKLLKKSADTDITDGNNLYTLAGAVYSVRKGNKEVGRLTVGKNGESNTLSALPYGSYTVQEITAAPGYALDPKVYELKLSEKDSSDTPYVLKVSDTPITYAVNLLLQKQASCPTDMPLSDALFTLEFYAGKTEASGSPTKSWVMKSDSEGCLRLDTEAYVSGDPLYLDSAGRPCLPLGCLLIRETKAPDGYLISERIIEYHMSEAGITPEESAVLDEERFVTEEVIFGGLSIEKQDIQTEGEAQGDASFEGAVYAVINMNPYTVCLKGEEDRSYESGTEVMRIVTDENGHAETGAILQYGSYKLLEISPPEGYTQEGENTALDFVIAGEDQIVSFTVKNRVIRFDIRIIKFQETPSMQEKGDDLVPLAGCVFGIYRAADEELIMTIQSDEDGVATTEDPENYPCGRLPYGSYIVRELEYPEGFMPVSDFYVTGTIDKKVYAGIYKNDQLIESPVTVVKTDEESQQIVALEGTKFQILDASKEPVRFHVFYPHYEEITDFVTDRSGSVTLPEKLPYGTYYVHEIAAPYGYLISEDTEFTVSESHSWQEGQEVTLSDKSVRGQIEIVKNDAATKEALAGAVFSVYAAEDIRTADGRIQLAEGELADVLKVDDSGLGKSIPLYLGNYRVKETKAPEGYCLDSEEKEVSLTADVKAELVWENSPTTLQLFKSDVDQRPMQGVAFTILRPGESEPGPRILTNGDGLITESYLRCGLYEIREVKSQPGYVAEEEPRFVCVDENGRIFESDRYGIRVGKESTQDFLTLRWINDCTKWEIAKTDEQGKFLEGAMFTLLAQDGTIMEEWESALGPHRIDALPEGIYTLVEELPPEGYVTSPVVNFTVHSDTELHTLNVSDAPTRVAVSKKERGGGEELEGAQLAILNEEGRMVCSWTSTNEPQLIEKLPFGSYILTEQSPPDGYQKAEDLNFDVEDVNALQVVTLYNERVGEESAKGAKTGDTAQLESLLFLMFLSAAVLLAMRTLYRKI